MYRITGSMTHECDFDRLLPISKQASQHLQRCICMHSQNLVYMLNRHDDSTFNFVSYAILVERSGQEVQCNYEMARRRVYRSYRGDPRE